ncbi:MAG: hypothetical protein K2J29_00135, partial [Muribaculaceae bacterium]|nr:hypothetical protein [Muribaculaceae bacterium]
ILNVVLLKISSLLTRWSAFRRCTAEATDFPSHGVCFYRHRSSLLGRCRYTADPFGKALQS